MKKAVLVAAAGLLGVFSAIACQAEELVKQGTQIKGTREEMLKSHISVKVGQDAKIVKIEEPGRVMY